METFQQFLDVILHLNRRLDQFVETYGTWWVYLILFMIIFCETGLVITPFLPGDSLLFAVGALASGEKLNYWMVCIILLVAAILGDTVNYWIGKLAGQKLVKRYPKLIKPKHLEQTHAFYERYGGKTIILARFVPIVRTFAPFVAGLGTMSYKHFTSFNIIGGILWVFSLVSAGYFFGNIPLVKKHFSLVILIIIFLSILPGLIEFWREWRRRKSSSSS